MNIEAGAQQRNFSWRLDLVRPHDGGRDTILVWATNPLRSALAGLVRSLGYVAITPATPLDAIRALIADGDRFGYALLAATGVGCTGCTIREFLGEEYPHIECMMLDLC